MKEQRTIARKRDKALLAALFVFTIVVAGIAALGMLLIQPPKDITQGQADCEQVRVSGKLPGRVVRFYVKEGDYVHKGESLATFYGAADKFEAAAAEYRSGLVYGAEKPEETPLVYALVTKDGVERY